jgi:BirA family biotin operon repressor/biotin-[acetyl-CoA-carboxylase] ligase
MQLTAANLQIAFRNSTSVRHFFFYPAIASTNDKAKELAIAGAEEGTIIIADAQSAGRGRLGRSWHSPAGLGLYVSFIFRPGVPASDASGILMAVGLGAAEAAERSRIQGVVGIKWPNDLVVEGRKLGGILIEMGVQGGVLEWCVAGIGLNVDHTDADFPVDLRDRAISLRQCCHRHVDRLGVLLALVECVSAWYGVFRNEGTAPLVPHWRRRSAILGRTVRVETAGEAVMGTAVGLEPDGALRVRLESGAEEILHAGDVHLVQYR